MSAGAAGRTARPDGRATLSRPARTPASVERAWTARLKPRSRLLFALAALLLLPAFFLPLWSITLRAPQYPDGLGMDIHIDRLAEHERYDLQNINILNHYIGMQEIEPEAIPELRYMPWVLGAFVALGLAGALLGRRWMLAAWLGLLLVAGAVGLADFFHWKWQFGHELSPDAPIKVPGMSYTPPFIGSKQLLNITASSWPSWGSLFLGLAAVTAAVTLWRTRRRPPAAGTAASVAVLAVLWVGCGPGGEPDASAAASQPDRGTDPAAETWTSADLLPANGEGCAYCGAPDTVRYGGEVTMADGRTHRFMSVECLAGFLLREAPEPSAVRSVRVVDFSHGRKLIDARSAIYLRSPNRPSPMGLNLLAVESPRVADNLHFAYGGELLDWEAVLAAVAREWSL